MDWEMVVKEERRLCTVRGETGYFHTWEQYSKPIEPSPMLGGHPGGVVSYILGIVEFEDGIRRVDPTEIKFCDEEHDMLELYNERNKTDEVAERLVEAERKEKELCPTCKFDNGGKCLTPIEDTDDVWEYSFVRGNGVKTYQCKRMSSFFKDVYPDGSVKYNDVDRVVKVDMVTDTIWHSGFIDRIVDELYPITMPYIPKDKPYKVYCEDFLTDSKNGDYDTVGVLYGVDPYGDRFEINRYFKDGDHDMIEIDKEEYESRKLIDKERGEKLKGERYV